MWEREDKEKARCQVVLTIEGMFQVRIIKNQEWAVPAQLERDFLQAVGTYSSNQFPNTSLAKDIRKVSRGFTEVPHTILNLPTL